jgi:exodeoxyribonuclease VII large subunit
MRSKCAVYLKSVNAYSDALISSLNLSLEKKRAKLDQLAAKLSVLSPYSVLERGYSLTTNASGVVIKNADTVKPGDEITTRLASGEIRSVVKV